jgi:ribosomal protein S18 acetylase RimI-like enzyme
MTITSLTPGDNLEAVGAMTPEGWSNLAPHFAYNILSPFCAPFKAVIDGELAGLGNIIYNEDTAWLAQIVVHPAYRNRGVGKAITAALLDHIDRSRYPTVLLDATDMGYAVYRQFGFETISYHVHYGGAPLARQPQPDNIIACTRLLEDEVLLLDRRATGENRSNTLLEHTGNAILYREQKEITGVYFPTVARGAIIAANAAAGTTLMRLRMQDMDHAMLPEENKVAAAFLEQQGFTVIRKSRRMRLGAPRAWEPGFIYNTISGALG